MEVYLKDEMNNYTFRYPVAPLDEIKITKKKRYTTHEIIDFGTIDLPQLGEEMEEISFETIFPKEYDASYCNYSDLVNPYYLRNKFDEFKNSDTPLRLIITEIGINELVFLSEFSATTKAGEEDDLYIENKFRKYREASIANPSSIKPIVENNTSALKIFVGTDRYTEDIIKSGDLVKVNSKSINVHAEADLTSSVVGTLSEGQTITIVRVQGRRWGNVAWSGSAAWIDLNEVSKVQTQGEV